MKVLIEIDEHNKNVIDRFADEEGCDILPERIFADLIESVTNGVSIPDNATNGEVIQALFGGMQINEPQNENDLVYIEHLYFGFPAYWWNSPYKENRHEEN